MKFLFVFMILILALHAQATLTARCNKEKTSCILVTQPTQGNYQIYFDGEILKRTPSLFKHALSFIPQNTDFELRLNSPGGYLVETSAIRYLLAQKCDGHRCFFSSFVSDRDVCNSACVELYASANGEKRYEPKASFGFHATQNMETGLLMSNIAVRTLMVLGFNKNWVYNEYKKGTFCQVKMTYYLPHELKDSGIFKPFRYPTDAQVDSWRPFFASIPDHCDKAPQ